MKIIGFFKQYPLKTSKQKSFEIFCEVIVMMNDKEHLTTEGLKKIVELISKMNRQVKRNLESSEAIRRTH